MATPNTAAKKILIADDDNELIQKLKMPLAIKGYETLEAYDGLKALEVIRQSKPDLVILDILMPKLDGLKLTRLFKFDERYGHIPVILVSHVTRSYTEEDFRYIGVDSFFSKPIQVIDVIQEVEKLVNRQKK